jgi:hypothetical protein
MKKMMKKNSAAKKMIPALGMLMISASMLATSTYAWFTMSDTVSVTGMKLKATAEDGLLISDYTKTNWATSWTVTMDNAAVLAPTSAAAAASPAFVSAKSNRFDNADAYQANPALPDGGYTALSTLTYDGTPNTGEGIGSVTTGTGNAAQTTNYVLLRKFYIKGSGNAAWAQNLVIDEVTASIAENATSTAIENSLRVLVVAGTNAFIYAPNQNLASGTTTMSYKYNGTTDVTALAPATDSTCTSITSIPAGNTESPIEVAMYMYFEGEDANCKSSNVSGITLNDITVSAKFKTADVPAQQNPEQQGG